MSFVMFIDFNSNGYYTNIYIVDQCNHTDESSLFVIMFINHRYAMNSIPALNHFISLDISEGCHQSTLKPDFELPPHVDPDGCTAKIYRDHWNDIRDRQTPGKIHRRYNFHLPMLNKVK